MASPRLTVALTRRLPSRIEAALESRYDVRLRADDAPPGEAELRRLLAGADVLVPTVADPLPARVFEPAPRTRLIANYGVGVNHIDLVAAQRAGILVTNTPGVLTDATAELAITLMLMVARRASEGERLVRSGRWTGWAPTQLLGMSLSGRTLGIVGMGRIGSATARRAASGLGMRIRYYSRSEASAELLGGVDAVRDDSLELLLERADVISLHCPLTPATRHLINAERLALMPRHALLVNTARGEVIDEDALAAAVTAGRIAGCGLDVHEREPAVHPVLAVSERAVLLPHLGSATVEAREAMGELVLRNIEAFGRGEPPPNLVS